MPRADHITVEDLARLLGLEQRRVLALLERRGVRAGRGRSPARYHLPAVVAALTKRELATLREAQRAERMQVRTSRNWIAGYPDLVAQWHPTRNVDLFPDEVAAGSTKRIWWRCPKGPDHEWSSQARTRARMGRGCPFCSGARVSVTNSLATCNPRLAEQWDRTRNGKLTPSNVTTGSKRRVAWQCDRGPDHRWIAEVNTRNRGAGCPFCAGQRVSVTNSLATRAPNIAAQWFKSRNGGRSPERVNAGTPERAWWRCTRDRTHVWQASVKSRVQNRLGCPFCSGKRATRATSLASVNPDLAREWDCAKNEPLTPADVRPKSGKKVWWICSRDPRHRFAAIVADRSYGRGCPVCTGRAVDATNSLATTFPQVAREWHRSRNGALTPRDVTRGSGRRVWWQCGMNPKHVWLATILNRTAGTRCPECARSRR